MNQDDKRLEAILRGHGITECPTCHIAITVANIGWNTRAEDYGLFPIVYIACKHCWKRLKYAYVALPEGRFIESREEAIDELDKTSVLSDWNMTV